MDIFEAITKRYSCRAYKSLPIESDKLAKVLEAGRLAPSARNRQDWRFIVVTDSEIRNKLADAANGQQFIATAPAVVVACSNCPDTMSCGQPVGPIDVAIALEHIALQATALGLATCWIGAFDADKVKTIIGIPQDVSVIELMPIGYPADMQPSVKRESVDNIVCYEKWKF